MKETNMGLVDDNDTSMGCRMQWSEGCQIMVASGSSRSLAGIGYEREECYALPKVRAAWGLGTR